MPPRVRRSSRSFGRSSARRKLVWATREVDSLITGNFNADLLQDLRGPGVSVLGCTVMRTHIRAQLTWASTGTPSDSSLGIGLTVENLLEVTAQTVTWQDAGQDWALLDRWRPATGINFIPGAGGGLLGGFEGFIIDLRAKRKVQELGETWCFVGSVPSGQESVQLRMIARTLVALP